MATKSNAVSKAKIDEAVSQVRNPSVVGPLGNPGNHNNQGFKNAQQVAALNTIYKAETLIEEQESISGAIRFLASEGYEIGAIAKFLGKRYQHVRNVLKAPVSTETEAEVEHA